MSGQSKRSRWRHLQRRRWQLARLLARHVPIDVGRAGDGTWTGLAWMDTSLPLRAGGRPSRQAAVNAIRQAIAHDICTQTVVPRIDVHAARQLAERLVSEGSALGRDLLDALAGQPSECQAGCIRVAATLGRLSPAEPGDFAQPRTRVQRSGARVTCPTCRGTGHNLRGVLPPVVASPQMIRRLSESEGGFYTDAMAAWLDEVADAHGALACPGSAAAGEQAEALELLGPGGVNPRTRVVPRGEHRLRTMVDGTWLDAVISARILTSYAQLADEQRVLPRWRRGELRHAERRRPIRHSAPRKPAPEVD